VAAKKSKSDLDTAKLVLVEWLDALAQGEWHEAKREDLKCKTVGFVVFEDDEQIELAGTITAGMCNNSITIPKKMLTKVKEIKLENKLRKTKRSAVAKMDRPETTREVSTVNGQGLTQLSNGESR
jgi:basic membrane lipoprotein Med (substrate-binding protein (PBP1-ABC) superfamily)